MLGQYFHLHRGFLSVLLITMIANNIIYKYMREKVRSVDSGNTHRSSHACHSSITEQDMFILVHGATRIREVTQPWSQRKEMDVSQNSGPACPLSPARSPYTCLLDHSHQQVGTLYGNPSTSRKHLDPIPCHPTALALFVIHIVESSSLIPFSVASVPPSVRKPTKQTMTSTWLKLTSFSTTRQHFT